MSFQAGVRGELDEFRVSRDQRPTAEASADFKARNELRRVPMPVLALLVAVGIALRRRTRALRIPPLRPSATTG